jgi:hypothetical protein
MLIAAFELDDSIVVTKNGVNLGFGMKACLIFDIRVLIMRVFEKCVLVDSARKTAEAGSDDVRDTRGW